VDMHGDLPNHTADVEVIDYLVRGAVLDRLGCLSHEHDRVVEDGGAPGYHG